MENLCDDIKDSKYLAFLKSKMAIAKDTGFEIDTSELNPALLPHQKDIIKWAIKGGRRAVFAQFGGIGTVPMTAIKMGRFGMAVELNPDYFRDGVGYCKAEEDEIDMPTLFDYLDKVE